MSFKFDIIAFAKSYIPGTKGYHARFCSRIFFPCRCVFDNDKDYEKYGDSFMECFPIPGETVNLADVLKNYSEG